jgi:hypothetical protein
VVLGVNFNDNTLDDQSFESLAHSLMMVATESNTSSHNFAWYSDTFTILARLISEHLFHSDSRGATLKV